MLVLLSFFEYLFICHVLGFFVKLLLDQVKLMNLCFIFPVSCPNNDIEMTPMGRTTMNESLRKPRALQVHSVAFNDYVTM